MWSPSHCLRKHNGVIVKTEDITLVRIYCTEAQHKLDALLTLLQDEEKVAGVTAFRGIAGFGGSGKMHSASLLDLSLDMPLVIEFFDKPEKVRRIMQDLNKLISPGHMVSWSAKVNASD